MTEEINIDFDKSGGLVPAIVQDDSTGKVLMLAYMNREALDLTRSTSRATFFSRSRNSLWTKGETSGNFLPVKQILIDCDSDTILIKASPAGPVCHTGSETCFNETNSSPNFLADLEAVIRSRKNASPETSYTAELFSRGIKKIAQKVGEESAEMIIEAVDGDRSRLKEEAADLLYHYIVLLAASDVRLDDVTDVLRERQGRGSDQGFSLSK